MKNNNNKKNIEAGNRQGQATREYLKEIKNEGCVIVGKLGAFDI